MPVKGRFPPSETVCGEAAAKDAETGPMPCHQELFEVLRQQRRELAACRETPSVCDLLRPHSGRNGRLPPQTAEGMLTIHGVGEAKLEKLWRHFHVDHRELLPGSFHRGHSSAPARAASQPAPRAGGRRRHIVIGEAFNAGQSVADLAQRIRHQGGDGSGSSLSILSGRICATARRIRSAPDRSRRPVIEGDGRASKSLVRNISGRSSKP